MAWPQHSWRYSNIQGAGGVLTLLNDSLNFYTGKRRRPLRLYSGGQHEHGCRDAAARWLHLRRGDDGRLAGDFDDPATVVKICGIFGSAQTHLFVNAVIQPSGFLQVAVLDVETQLPLADFPLNGSSIEHCGVPAERLEHLTPKISKT